MPGNRRQHDGRRAARTGRVWSRLLAFAA